MKCKVTNVFYGIIRGCMQKVGRIKPRVVVIAEAVVVLSSKEVVVEVIPKLVLVPTVGLVVILVVEVAADEIMRLC